VAKLDDALKNRNRPRGRPVLVGPWLEVAAVIATIVFVLWAWEVFAEVKQLPTFFLPKPSVIGERFVEALRDGTLTRNAIITWSEALLAFGLAFLFASVVGYWLAKSPLLEKIISPYLIASQSLPIFALAPFVLIWLGNGFTANVFMGSLVAFFPMLINTLVSIRAIDPEQRELLLSFAADGWQTFVKLELPAALPVIFAGARVGVTLSVIGVLVVELFWADRGLGYLLNFAQRQFDTPLLFAGILTLLIMNLTMYIALAWLQRLVMPWRYIPRETR
jgi:ABC-type nitrate/sulfonate/bicarbonate transport system permease component